MHCGSAVDAVFSLFNCGVHVNRLQLAHCVRVRRSSTCSVRDTFENNMDGEFFFRELEAVSIDLKLGLVEMLLV